MPVDPLQFAVLDLAWRVRCLPLRSRRMLGRPMQSLLGSIRDAKTGRQDFEARITGLRSRLDAIGRAN